MTKSHYCSFVPLFNTATLKFVWSPVTLRIMSNGWYGTKVMVLFGILKGHCCQKPLSLILPTARFLVLDMTIITKHVFLMFVSNLNPTKCLVMVQKPFDNRVKGGITVTL